MESKQGVNLLSTTLDNWCGYYLSIGCDYNDFWQGNSEKLHIYEQAYDRKRKQTNFDLWLQGIYIRDSLMATVGNMFKGKNAPTIKYPDRPYPLTEIEIEEEEIRQQREREEKIKTAMLQFIKQSKRGN